jgi:PAS domain S-box-containing protein
MGGYNISTSNVLIIDDEPYLREMLVEALSEHEYRVSAAESGREGLAVARRTSPEVIILDLKMSDMDGFEFLAELRPEPSDPYAIVVITGQHDGQVVRKCYEAGASAFLNKPFSVSELKAAVEIAVTRKHAQRLQAEVTSRVAELERANEQLTSEIVERKHAEELSSYQARLLENVSDAIIAADEHFVTTHWDRAAEELYGWTAEEAVGRRTAELLQPQFVDVELEEVLRRLTEEGLYEGEVVQTRKDGTKVTVEARALALADEDGRITAFVSVDRDITERRRAQEALRETEERYRDLFHDSRDAVYVSVKGGDFVDVNSSMVEMFGYTREEMLDLKGVTLYADPADRSRVLGEVESAGSIKDVEVRYRRKDGTVIDWPDNGERATVPGRQGGGVSGDNPRHH